MDSVNPIQPLSDPSSSNSSPFKKNQIAYNFNDWEWEQDEIDFSNSDWHHHQVNFAPVGVGVPAVMMMEAEDSKSCDGATACDDGGCGDGGV